MCNASDNRHTRSLDSLHTIRNLVAGEMRAVFCFHMRVTVFLAVVQIYVGQLTSPIGVCLSLAIFVNSLCMAERFWDLQLNSLIFWPPTCQLVFLVSRLLLVSVAIICTMLWAKLGWLAAESEWEHLMTRVAPMLLVV
jgi:hypothetical protein